MTCVYGIIDYLCTDIGLIATDAGMATAPYYENTI